MATVIGIFETQYKKGLPLTVVKPGSQTRRFTHINDTVKVCLFCLEKNKCKHYSISNKKSYSILKLQKCLAQKISIYPKKKVEKDMRQH